MFWAFLFLAARAIASPSFDATAASGGYSSAFTWSHTVANKNNRVLFVHGGHGTNITTSITAATYGGVALTRLTDTASGTNLYQSIWYLINPAVGTANIIVRFGTSEFCILNSSSYYGAKQTGNLTNYSHEAGGFDSSAIALTLTTTVNESAIIGFIGSVSIGGGVWGHGWTALYATGNSGNTFGDSGLTKTAGAGSYGSYWNVVGVSRKQLVVVELLEEPSVVFVGRPSSGLCLKGAMHLRQNGISCSEQ